MNLNGTHDRFTMALNGTIDEHWPTLGGGTIHVVIPADHRRPWPDCQGTGQVWPDGELSELATREYRIQHHHQFGMAWPQDGEACRA